MRVFITLVYVEIALVRVEITLGRVILKSSVLAKKITPALFGGGTIIAIPRPWIRAWGCIQCKI
jgi:hypothetical protein